MQPETLSSQLAKQTFLRVSFTARIAVRFKISENAVKNILDDVKEKTGVQNRNELAFYI